MKPAYVSWALEDNKKIPEQWVGFDLDGTLAFYDVWKGIEHIGEPIPKMVKILKEHLAKGDICKIFTARVAIDDVDEKELTEEFIQDWCGKHFGQLFEITNIKDQGMIKLYDDKAVQVNANTGELVGE
jgi:hypothetical protein